MMMARLNHTRFSIPVVFFCLEECFLKNIVFLEKGLSMPIKKILLVRQNADITWKFIWKFIF